MTADIIDLKQLTRRKRSKSTRTAATAERTSVNVRKRPARPDDVRAAYMALEPKLRDVRRMADIAFLAVMRDFEDPGEESLGLTAIEQLERMIYDLNQTYYSAFPRQAV